MSTDRASGSCGLEARRPAGLCVVGGTVQVGSAEVGALQVGTVQARQVQHSAPQDRSAQVRTGQSQRAPSARGSTSAIPVSHGESGRPATRKRGRKIKAGLPGPYGHRQPRVFSERKRKPPTSGQRLSLSGLRSPLLDRHRDIKRNRLSQHGISRVGICYIPWLGRRDRYHGRSRTKPIYHKVEAIILVN